MRANEFIIKENIFDKIGDAANKQVIQRRQTDRASVKNKNLPSITKAVQDILASQVAKFLNSAKDTGGVDRDSLNQLVSTSLSKLLKVNITDNKYRAELNELVTLIASAPGTVAQNKQITSSIAEIAEKAISTAEPVQQLISDKSREKFDKIVKGMSKEDAKEKITKLLKENDWSDQKIEAGLEEYFAYADDLTFPDSEDEQGGEPEEEQGDEQGDEQEDAPADVDEEFLDKFIDNIKEHLFRKQHDIDLRDPESVADFIEFNVKKHSEQLGITAPEQANKIVDDLLADPDMAFNFKAEEKFKGSVYSEGGLKYKSGAMGGENIAYAQDSSHEWSEWMMHSTTQWRLRGKVVDIITLKALEDLKGAMSTKMFTQEKTGGRTNLYRVSNR